MIEIIVPTLILMLIGFLLLELLSKEGSQSTVTKAIIASGIGLSILPVIGYLVVISVGFSFLSIYLPLVALLLLLLVLYLRRYKTGSLQRPAINKRAMFTTFLALGVASVSLILRARSILASRVIAELDPWVWFYNTEVLAMDGVIDYSTVGAYPMGFVMFAGLLSISNPVYSTIYDIIRFIGPALSFVTTLVVFHAFYTYFEGNWQGATIGGLGFAVGNLLQFRGRMATPETMALLLFVIFLSYLFIYKGKSPFIASILLAGLVMCHPTTALVAFGIWFLTVLKKPESDSFKNASLKLLLPVAVFLLLLAPLLISMGTNTDLIERYAYYLGGTGLDIPSDPLMFSQAAFNELIVYSLGLVIFGVSFIGALRYILFEGTDKWAFMGWGLCVLWSLISFLPVIFIYYAAPRAATFVVFPAMILVVREYLTLTENREIDITLPSNFLRKPVVKKTIVFVLIISVQMLYGYSFGYINQRYISDEGLQVLEFLGENGDTANATYVYDQWVVGFWYARVVLKNRISFFSNDTFRYTPWETTRDYLDSHGNTILVCVLESEYLYSIMVSEGHQDLLNVSGLHVFQYQSS